MLAAEGLSCEKRCKRRRRTSCISSSCSSSRGSSQPGISISRGAVKPVAPSSPEKSNFSSVTLLLAVEVTGEEGFNVAAGVPEEPGSGSMLLFGLVPLFSGCGLQFDDVVLVVAAVLVAVTVVVVAASVLSWEEGGTWIPLMPMEAAT